MFLTNIDTVVMALFLGCGILLVVLMGILASFRFQYKETKTVLSLFFKLVGIYIISLSIYAFIFLFRWPEITDIFICAILSGIGLWFYLRLFIVFRQFINTTILLTCVVLTIINFAAFTIQIMFDINLTLLLFAFLSLILVISIHFLVLSILIKFRGEVNYDE